MHACTRVISIGIFRKILKGTLVLRRCRTSPGVSNLLSNHLCWVWGLSKNCILQRCKSKINQKLSSGQNMTEWTLWSGEILSHSPACQAPEEAHKYREWDSWGTLFIFHTCSSPFCFQVNQRSLSLWKQWCWCWWQCWTASSRVLRAYGCDVWRWAMWMRWEWTQKEQKKEMRDDPSSLRSPGRRKKNKEHTLDFTSAVLLPLRASWHISVHIFLPSLWLNVIFCHKKPLSEHRLSLLLSARHV